MGRRGGKIAGTTLAVVVGKRVADDAIHQALFGLIRFKVNSRLRVGAACI